MSVRASQLFLGKPRPQETNVVILDEEGNDVTPQSLFAGSNRFPGGKLASTTGGTNTAEGSLMASMTKVNLITEGPC
jgi:hypothetical protein